MKNTYRSRRHATTRGSERYGLKLSAGEYTALSARIAFHELTGEQDVVKLSYVGGGRDLWAVWFKGEWMPVVFDTETARIVTILPTHTLRKHRGRLPW